MYSRIRAAALRASLALLTIVLTLVGRSQTYTPVALSGFNADVIANGSAFAGSVTADVDGGSYYFLNQSFTAFGTPTFFLPTSGLLNSTSTPGLSFQLASAGGNNSLRLPPTANGTSSTLSFGTPVNAGTVYLLATSGGGASTINVTVNFSDASSQTFNALSVPDWYTAGTVVVQGIGRVNGNGAGSLDNAGGTTNPRLFQLALSLSGDNFFKTITGITVTKASAAGYTQVMGVSVAAPCAVPAAQPSALNLSSASTSSISGSFTATTADQYLVVRYPAAATPTAPVNGITYTAGQSLGAGTVVQSGATTSFTASGLNAATAYAFYVYAFNNTACIGPVYNTTAPLTATQSTNGCAAVTGTITVGPTGDFATLTAAYNSLSTGISGPVVLELQPTYSGSTEPAYPIQLGFNNCFNSVNTVTIRPAAGATGLSLLSAGGGPTVDLNGARWVRIDGRPGGTGTTSQLSIINTSTTGAALRFINDAQNNIVTYCDLQGQNNLQPANPATVLAGVVYFGAASTTGLQGNDNNTLSFNSIHGTATGTPSFGILASTGTTPATDAAYNDLGIISNNRIYDIFSANGQSNYIKLDAGSNAWTITGNSFYQTATRTVTAGNTHRAIWITPGTSSVTTANGFTVTNNFIGGTAANAGGTALTMNGAFATVFWGMDISVGLGTPTTVQGNAVANLNITTNATGSPSGFMGISQNQGNVSILNNTIGSPTGTGSVTVTTTAATTNLFVYGIRITGGTNATAIVSGNSIGSITTVGSGTLSLGITGIQVSGGANVTVTQNQVGSLTTANSLNASSATTGIQSVIGIASTSAATGTITIADNTIANLNNNFTGTGAGLTQGIVIGTSGTPVYRPVAGNTVRNLSSSSAGTGTGTTAAITGIVTSNTNAAGLDLVGNTIHSLASNAATAGVQVTGIFYTGSTAFNSSIVKNNIHSFDIPATNVLATFTGMDYANGTATIANNFIRLGIRTDGTSLSNEVILRGISSNSGSAFNRIAFNTIYIGGTGVGTAARNTFAITRTATSGTYDIRNNILVNNRSNATTGGKHYTLFLTTASTGAAPDYNIYQYAGTGGVFAFNGTADVPAYTTGWIAGDVHSYNTDPLLVAPLANAAGVNLHLQNGSPAESTGSEIAGISEDIDGETRAALSPTDIGADAGNFAPAGLDLGLTALVDPAAGTCPSATQVVSVRLKNYSSAPVNFASNPVTVTVTATGGYNSSVVVSTGTLASGAVQTVVLPATINMSAAGSFTFNGNASATGDVNAVNNAMAPETRTVVAGASLAGTYTVGATGNYTTLTAAVAAYNSASCLSGNVVFELTDPLYSAAETFPIVINGNASNFTLTIRPAAGVNATITGTSGTVAGALIRLNGARNVLIDGVNTGGSSLTIENTSATSGTAVIWLSSNGLNAGASNNTIRNLSIKGGIAQNTSTNTSYGVVIAGSTMSGTITSVTGGDDNDNNLIEANSFSKLRYAIYTRGGSVFNPNAGTIIRNNIVGPTAFGADQIGKAGIVVREEEGIVISGNEVRFVGANFANMTSGTDRAGIVLSTDATWTGPTAVFVKNAQVVNNRIHDIVEERTFSSLGVILAAADGLNPTGNLVANNMIYGVLANGTGGDQALGLAVNAGNGDRIAFNTIYLTGDTDPNAGATAPSTSSFGISVGSASVLNLRLNSNLVFMDLSSSSAAALRHAALNIPGGFNWGSGGSNYNDWYINPLNIQSHIGTVGGSGGTYYTTLAAWQSATAQDANSISAAPSFVSATDLHLVPGLNVAINDKATPVAGVTTDIDGQARSGATPDPGADEFVLPAGVDLAASTLVTPVVKPCYSNAESVSVSIRNFGASTVDFSVVPATITVTVTGPVSTTLTRVLSTGTLAAGDSLIVALTPTLDMSATGTYSFSINVNSALDVNAANNVVSGITRTLVPVAAGTVTSSLAAICVSGTPTLTLTGSAGGAIQWQEASAAAGPYTNVGTNSATYTPAAPITTTRYYQAQVSCNANSVTTTPLEVVVNNPQVASVGAGTRCGPGQVILTGTPSAGATLNWYAAATGGTALGTGNLFTTATLPTTTTFYVSASIGACESARQPVVATVNAAPALGLTTATTICNNSIKELTVTTPAANFNSYVWSPAAGLFTDNTATTPYTGGSATTVYMRQPAGGVYTYTLTANNTSTSCQNIDSVKITVLPAPITIAATPAEICVSGTSTLTLNPGSGYGNASFQWQSSTDNTNFNNITGAVGGTYTTPVLTATGYYRAVVRDGDGNTCVQPSITIAVNNPQVLTSTPATLCSNGPVTLQATGTPGSIIRWYAAATGGAALGSGNSFVTPALTTTTTYYAAAENGTVLGAGGSTSTSYESPFYYLFGGKTSQYLVLASELTALGVTPGNISSLGFNVVSANSTFNNFAISMRSTTATAMTTTMQTGLSTVYTAASVTPVPGINTFTFQTPFVWDGTSNVVVQVCWSNNNTGGTNSSVRMDATSFVSHAYFRADNQSSAAVCGAAAATATQSLRPQMFFNSSGYCAGVRVPVVATISGPTTITTQPTAQQGCVGGSITLSVNATGAGLSYQWKRGTTNVGTNSNTLTINPLTLADAGSYTVTITGTCGTATSNAVNVTVGAGNNWIGAQSSDWNTAANWCGGIPTATTDVTILSGTPYAPVINGIANARNITVSAGTSLTVTAGGQFNVYGDFTNNGTFSSPTGFVFFRGAANQNVSGFSSGNVLLNGAGGLTLTGNASIGTLVLQSGNLTLGNNTLTLTNSASGSVASHIVTNGTGNVVTAATGAGPVIVPVGPNATSYNPVTIANGGGQVYNVRVAVGLNPTLLDNQRAVNRTWTVTPNGAVSSDVSLTLQYDNAHGNTNFNGSSVVDIGRHNGTIWTLASGGNGFIPVGGATERQVTVLTQAFGPFAVSSPGGISYPTSTPNVNSDVVGMVMMPNAVESNSVLRIVGRRAVRAEFRILDAGGREVMRFQAQLQPGMTDLPLRLMHLRAGMYFISGQTDKGRIDVLRFVKL